MAKEVKEDITRPDEEYAWLLKVLGESNEAGFWHDYVVRRYGPHARVLEFGAGAGNLAIPLARTGIHVTAVEIDPYSARNMQDNAPANLEVITGRVENLNLAGKYEVILSKSCLLFMPRTDVAGFFASAARHLSPSGVFFAEVPDEKWMREEGSMDNGMQVVFAKHDAATGLWSLDATYRVGKNGDYRMVESYALLSDGVIDAAARPHGLHLDVNENIKLCPITKFLSFRPGKRG